MIQQIPLNKIVYGDNVRKSNDRETERVNALAESMHTIGQQVPVEVFLSSGEYILKFGYGRVQAAKQLGWETIQAIVSAEPVDAAQLLIEQYVENVQRNELEYLDRANVFFSLKSRGMTQREIASACGTTESEVSLALATLRADPKLQAAIASGRIKPSAIEPLLSQSLQVQAELADAAISAGTVRRVKMLIGAHKRVQDSRNTEVEEMSDDVTPAEMIALASLEEALSYIKQAMLTPITTPQAQVEYKRLVSAIIKQLNF